MAAGKVWSAGPAEEEGGRAAPQAWVLRALPRTQEILKIYPAWLK